MNKSDIRIQVEEFMVAAKQDVKDCPTVPNDKIIRLRAKLVMEEAFELLESLFGKDVAINNSKEIVNGLINNMPINVDMVEFADACGDIDYVVEGARLAFGINGKPIADEVQRTNMAKFGPGSWVRESDGKQMKPEGWQAPDIKKLLNDQGWSGD